MLLRTGHKVRIIKPGSRGDLFLEKQLGSSLFTYRQILAMLVPLILDQLFINLISLLTTAMISSSSQESISAVSIVSPFYMVVYSVFSAISVGGTVIVAQYKGRNDDRKIRMAAGQVIMSSALLAIISCILLATFASQLIHGMFGAASPLIQKKASNYLIGVAISQIFLSLYLGASAIFRGLGEAKTCLRLTIVINLIHLLASVLFLNVMHLDIFGTALSLNIARFIGAAVAIWLLLRPKSIIKIQARHIFSFHFSILKSIFHLSIPYALEQIFFYGGSMLVQTYIVGLGTNSVSANAVAGSAFSIFYSAGIAVGILATTVVGQCAGAGEKALAKWYGSKMVHLGTFIIILSILLVLPLMPLILYLYQAPPSTLDIIHTLLWITLIPMPFFWSTSNVMPSVLRSTGDSAFTSTVSLITMWIIRVGLGYLLTILLGLGVSGVWISMGAEWVVRSLIFYLRYRSGIWLTKRTID